MKQVKIYINDLDTLHETIKKNKEGKDEVKTYIQLQDTVTGYVTTFIQDNDDPSVSLTSTYYINTARPITDVIHNYKNGYLGRVKDHNNVAKKSGATVATGNIIKSINSGKGKQAVACFIAVFDDDKCSFEIHYPTGAIFHTFQVEFVKNKNEQRESKYKELVNTKSDIESYFPAKVIPTARRRESSKLTYEDEQAILGYLINNVTLPAKKRITQKELAKAHGISSQYISQLKKQWKAEGKL